MAGLNPTKRQMERLRAAFREVKAENDSVLNLPESNTFVHTKVYRDVQDTRRCLLIGRKGSGKTALLVGYRNEHRDKYLTPTIDIKADDFPLENLFEFFYTDSQKAVSKITSKLHKMSDLPDFVDPVKIASYAWTQSLVCAAIYRTAEKLLDGNIVVDDSERKKLQRARAIIGKYMGISSSFSQAVSGNEIVYSLLIYFFQSAQGVIDSAIGIHTHEISVLLAAITLGLSRKFSDGMDTLVEKAAGTINRTYEKHQKKTLITLDKFDDFYDEFYRSRPGKESTATGRREFLNTLLQGLVLATRDINRDERFRWLDTLFTIPMDKFLEIHLRERADLEHSHVLRLDWTPLELLDYVNRRIAYALELPSERKDEAWELLFPFRVTNGKLKEVKEDSFLYIVRHSLWKPREIQMYLSAILGMMDEMRLPADEEMFRKVVKFESEKIIRREFLEEFLSEYPGMPRVLKKLENLSLKTVMSYEEVCDKLSGLSLFEYANSVDQVMLRLFHMGVLGIRQVLQAKRSIQADATITQNKEEVLYRYCYNHLINDPFDAGVSVAFHPMFFEYLNIKHEEKYVVNQLSWDMFLDTPV